MTDNRHTRDLTKLILFIDTAMMQATVVKDNPHINHRLKQVFNQFFNHGRTLTNHLMQYLERNNITDQYDDNASIIFEAMNELFKCEDKIKAVALLHALNEGQIIIEPDTYNT